MHSKCIRYMQGPFDNVYVGGTPAELRDKLRAAALLMKPGTSQLHDAYGRAWWMPSAPSHCPT